MAEPLNVLVLAGGDSSERDVSLDSARGMAHAAARLGHRVRVIDPFRVDGGDGGDIDGVCGEGTIAEVPPGELEGRTAARRRFAAGLAETAGEDRFDVVLNGLHGGAGEDGTIQAILEFLGLRGTGSGAAACALAMDKYRAKQLAAAVGVPVPQGVRFGRRRPAEKSAGEWSGEPSVPVGRVADAIERVGLPAVVKPACQGSSVGLTVVTDSAVMGPAVEEAFRYDDQVLVERYIEGVELTVAVLDGVGELPILEIRPKSGLYDYYHKYQSGASRYLVPAPIPSKTADAVAYSARRAFDALGCRAYGRVDFRLDPEGFHYMLEVNTLPGMTATSLVPKAARAAGIEYDDLVERILRLALV